MQELLKRKAYRLYRGGFYLRMPLRVMKILTILLFVLALHSSARTYSQGISLEVKNATLEEVFRLIENQSGFSFVYSRESLDRTGRVSLRVVNEAIDIVLDKALAGQPLAYAIDGKFIIIKVATPISETRPARLDISGKVINENGLAIAGATVTVKSSRTAVATNTEGEFLLTGIDSAAVLVVSSIGYEKKEVPVNGRRRIIIELKLAPGLLDESIVIAYGKTTRRFSTGSVSKITSEEIAMQPVLNPLAALQGRVPGLVVTATSGLPGASYNVQIRGQNSVDANPSGSIPPKDNPLFIIDGVPFAPQNASLNQFRSVLSPGNNVLLNNPYGGNSPFSTINPENIESIEVLRDADATAIYGSRGANGVIIITTKKGKPGKTKFSLKASTGVSMVGKTMKMMNTQDYIEMRKEAFANDGITPNDILYDPGYAPDLLIYDSTKYTDWKNYFIGATANQTDINVSLNGGTVSTQFSIDGGFNNSSYIYPGDFLYRRGSMGINLSHTTLNKKLRFDFSGIFAIDKNRTSGTPNLLSAFQMEPNYPDLLDSNGDIVWNYNGANLGGVYGVANPISFIIKEYSLENKNLLSNLQIDYLLLKDLRIRSSFGYNTLISSEHATNPAASQNPMFRRNAAASFGSVNFNSWIIEPQLEYQKKLHNYSLNILLGATFQQNDRESSSVNASGYQNDALLGSASSAPNKSLSDSYSEYKYNALFGRVSFIGFDRYLLNLNARRDGSSRFGPGNRFGNFGSIGVGWIFTEEGFLRNKIKWFNFGKIRTSFGTTGSDNIGDYQYVARWITSNYTYQNTVGYLPQNLANPDYNWAMTKKLEIGIELGFFNNRLLLNSVWYSNRSGNQLVYYPLPNQTGFSGVTQNWSALVENKGLEVQVNYSVFKRKNFEWTTSFNFSLPRNRLLKFDGIESSAYATKYIIGRSLSGLNKFRYYSINDTTGIYQFLTSKNTITYTPANISGANFNDIQFIGDLDPEFYGGWGNTFRYKGFLLNFFFEFRKQLGVNYLAQVYGGTVPGWQTNQPEALLNRWQSLGDKAEFQKYTSQYSDAAIAALQYFSQSDAVYSDASYLRLKTLSISYSLSEKLIRKLMVQGINLFISSQNVLTISGYKGNDPETQNFYGVPPLKTIVGGIQITL